MSGEGILFKNFAASGPILAPGATAGNVKIFGVTCDVAGGVKIVDGLGATRLDVRLPAGGSFILCPDFLLCQQGATLTLTAVTNAGILYGF